MEFLFSKTLRQNGLGMCYVKMATKIQSRSAASTKRLPQAKKAVSPARERIVESSMRDLFLSIAASGHKIPVEERARIPKDLAKNHEHYLYGHPKQ